MSVALIAMAAKIGLWVAVLLNVTPVMVWVERRGSALIQDRLGPNRVGPLGLLQSFADAIKFLFKEDLTPSEVDKPLYYLAPALAVPQLTHYFLDGWIWRRRGNPNLPGYLRATPTTV